jgi:hypothetical protein
MERSPAVLEFLIAHTFEVVFWAIGLIAIAVCVGLWLKHRFQRKRAEVPDVVLAVRDQATGRFRLAEFLCANPFSYNLRVTEIKIVGWDSGERIAPALWTESNNGAVPHFELADGRALSLNVEVRPSEEKRKWTPITFFAWHHRLPSAGAMRLKLRIRVEQMPSRRGAWRYEFDANIPDIGKYRSFIPTKTAS